MSQTADIIITNAKVFTADPANPQAEAVAVSGQRIAAVGNNQAVQSWRGPDTRLIDGQGHTLMPGPIDSHFHLFLGSLTLGSIQLEEVTSISGLTEAVRQFAVEHPDEPWLTGNGLRYNILPPGQRLTRHDLDEIVADRPLIIMAFDFHTAWANTLALRQANILSGGEITAPNSEIVRDEAGVATGELRERGAYDQVFALVPEPSEARKYELLKQGLARAAALGITSIHNMDGNAEQLARYAALNDVGELTLRVYCPFDITPETPPEALVEAVAMQQSSMDDMVRSGCVKFFMDGVVENYTALVLDDYAGQPDNRGGAIYSQDHFTRMATEADGLGLQIFVHAVGDGAVHRTLNGFAAVQQANGPRDSRHRIEHIELVHPEDLPRFAELGVIASMQPAHAMLSIDEPDPWASMVPESRWGCAFAWQTLRQAGAHLAFGSDWPVVTPNPFIGLHYALNRKVWAHGLPDQRQTLTETLLAYTRDAAYAEFQEHQKGQLAPGMLADMILLPTDIFTVPYEKIMYLYPTLTICDGKIVHERE